MRQYHISITKNLERCCNECPAWVEHKGHTSDWDTCNHSTFYGNERDIHESRWVGNFPTFCPLEIIK